MTKKVFVTAHAEQVYSEPGLYRGVLRSERSGRLVWCYHTYLTATEEDAVALAERLAREGGWAVTQREEKATER